MYFKHIDAWNEEEKVGTTNWDVSHEYKHSILIEKKDFSTRNLACHVALIPTGLGFVRFI